MRTLPAVLSDGSSSGSSFVETRAGVGGASPPKSPSPSLIATCGDAGGAGLGDGTLTPAACTLGVRGVEAGLRDIPPSRGVTLGEAALEGGPMGFPPSQGVALGVPSTPIVSSGGSSFTLTCSAPPGTGIIGAGSDTGDMGTRVPDEGAAGLLTTTGDLPFANLMSVKRGSLVPGCTSALLLVAAAVTTEVTFATGSGAEGFAGDFGGEKVALESGEVSAFTGSASRGTAGLAFAFASSDAGALAGGTFTRGAGGGGGGAGLFVFPFEAFPF